MTISPLDRFNRNFEIMPNGCHEWKNSLRRGYGRMFFRNRTYQAHVVSFILNKGEISEGLCVLHTCDNRKCVNPEHLYAGTHKQNYLDAVERKRFTGRRKVSFEDVQEIIRLYKTGDYNQTQLGKMFNIGQTQISRYVLFQHRLKY